MNGRSSARLRKQKATALAETRFVIPQTVKVFPNDVIVIRDDSFGIENTTISSLRYTRGSRRT